MAGSEPSGDQRPLLQRIGWFALLWLCGIAAVGLMAFLIRSVLL
jgi:hypothetical protein